MDLEIAGCFKKLVVVVERIDILKPAPKKRQARQRPWVNGYPAMVGLAVLDERKSCKSEGVRF